MKQTVFAVTLVALVAGCAGTADQPEAVATANLEPRSGSQVRGTVTFTQVGADIVRVSGEISGHSQGPKGFHVHDKGDCSDAQAMSAGGHFNPAVSVGMVVGGRMPSGDLIGYVIAQVVGYLVAGITLSMIIPPLPGVSS